MSVLVLTEEDLRRILREELRAMVGNLSRAPEDRRVTATEAAAAAGVSAATLHAWAKDGRIHRYGEGRNLRFSLAEVLAVVPEKRAGFSAEERAAQILRRHHG